MRSVLRSRSSRVAAFVLPVVLLVSACGEESASREGLIKALRDQSDITNQQAECIADAIYDGSFTDEQIQQFSDDASNPEVAAIQEAFTAALDDCL